MTMLHEDPLNLVIAGVGGQGNILLSRLVGRALVRKGYLVSIGETFGAAQRGGAVMSNVRISKRLSLGPLIPAGTVHGILSLEPLETLRMLVKYKSPDAMTLTNTQPLPPLSVLSMKDDYPDTDHLQDVIRGLSRPALFVDATGMALEWDAPIVANIIMLGALIATNLLPLQKQDMEAELKAAFGPDKVELNLLAFQRGMESISQART